jgi:hypothetical protein
MKCWFAVEPSGVDFFIVRPNLQVHKSVRFHGTSNDETYLPDTGTYMLVWKNREEFEQTLHYEVTIEPKHLSIIITTVVVIPIIFISLIYVRSRGSRTEPKPMGPN